MAIMASPFSTPKKDGGMKEVKLAYRGKQSKVVLTCLPVCKTLAITQKEFWVCEEDATWLMGTNPKMFDVKEIRETKPVVDEEPVIDPEPVVDEEPKGVPREKFFCPKCGKVYKEERWFLAHVGKCERGDFFCERCGERFTDKEWYESHVAQCEVEWTQPIS